MLVIPYLDRDPKKNAQMLSDQHLSECIIDLTSFYSWLFDNYDVGKKGYYYTDNFGGFVGLRNWYQENHENIKWLYTFYTAMFDEYLFRFEKEHVSRVFEKEFDVVPRELRFGGYQRKTTFYPPPVTQKFPTPMTDNKKWCKLGQNISSLNSWHRYYNDYVAGTNYGIYTRREVPELNVGDNRNAPQPLRGINEF